jgi:hypothetical protein
MSDTFNQIAPVYGNIIDEARKRLKLIERALEPEITGNMEYVAVSDLCALQFRKVFEGIALASLLAHGDLASQRLKHDTYRADKVLKGLERLSPTYYPHSCGVEFVDGVVEFEIPGPGSWLTKTELMDRYFEFDHHMHLGSLSRRKMQPTVLSTEFLTGILARSLALVTCHYISLKGDMMRLVCEARNFNAPVILTSADFALIRRDG